MTSCRTVLRCIRVSVCISVSVSVGFPVSMTQRYLLLHHATLPRSHRLGIASRSDSFGSPEHVHARSCDDKEKTQSRRTPKNTPRRPQKRPQKDPQSDPNKIPREPKEGNPKRGRRPAPPPRRRSRGPRAAPPRRTAACRPRPWMRRDVRPITVLRFWTSEGLTQAESQVSCP